MNAAELNDRYERLRRRLTGHTPGGGDGLVVLRGQGLHAWIEYVTAAPLPRRPETPAAPALGPSATTIERSPLVGLCTDMLLGVRAVQELVKRYAKLAGISRRVSPHVLRHSSATQLADMGTPIRVVQEICGHASVTTTQRYVHVNDGQRKQAVDALGEAWKRRERAVQAGS